MQSRTIVFLIVGLVCVSILPMLGPVTCAQHAELSITDVNFQLLKTQTVGTREIHYYTVIAVLHNSGDAASDDITVGFYDPDFNTTPQPLMKLSPTNTSLMPGETKTFVLQQWPTSLTGDIPINVSFSPTSRTVASNSYNSGYSIYTLSIGTTKTKATPGFDIVFLFIALAFLLYRKMKK